MNKKKLAAVLAVIALVFGTAACTSANSKDANVLKVASVPTPHNEILDYLQESGQIGDLKIEQVNVSSGETANQGTREGSVDANYFQHLPYLKDWQKQVGDNSLVSVADAHVEPLALYSTKIHNKNDIPDGAQIALPQSDTNFARGLLLLEKGGVIKLDAKPEDLSQIHETDIIDNPKHLVFKRVDDILAPKALDDKNVTGAIISGSYAMGTGLSIANNGVVAESAKDNPYANVFVTTNKKKDDPRIKKVADALTSKQTADWIKAKYGDSVVPVHG